MKKAIKNIDGAFTPVILKHALSCLFAIFLFSCSDSFNDYIEKENLAADSDNSNSNMPVISFLSSTSSIINDDETEHLINILLSTASQDTVSVTVTDLNTGTAEPGIDYSLSGWESPEIITFNPGETVKTIGIIPAQEGIIEGEDKTIIIELSSPFNALLGVFSHTITIIDDDSLPTVSFSASTGLILDENEIPYEVDINLSRASGEIITVTVFDSGTGTATGGTDYTLTGWTSPRVITFNPGEKSKTIGITPVQDTLDEDSGETVILELGSPVNAELGIYTHEITILDDDEYWVKLSDVATSRAGAATVIYNGWLYIYGGEDSLGVRCDFWRYNLATGAYEILATTGSGGYRAYATIVELDGRLYRFGGKDETGAVQDDKIMYFFDTTTMAWDHIDNSDTNGTWPDVRYSHVSVSKYESGISIIKKLYFQGGKDSSGNNLSGNLYILDFPASGKPGWSSLRFSYNRSEHSAVVYDNSIYFFGGYKTDTGEYCSDLWKFDMEDESFEEVITAGTTIIPPRGGIQIIENNGNFYVFGGRNTDDVFDDLWTYSTIAGRWTHISTALFKRCFYSAGKYNNALLIHGGYYLNSSGQKIYSSELWQYNLTGE